MKRLLIGGAAALSLAGMIGLGVTAAPPLPSMGAASTGGSAVTTGVCTGGPLITAASAAGFRDETLLNSVAVALAESGGVATATNLNTNGSTDYGDWQINSVHAGILAAGNWADPGDNAAMAWQVYHEAGDSFAPWVTYNSGAYRDHLGEAGDLVAGCTSTSDPGAGGQGLDGLRPRAVQARSITLERWGCAAIQTPCIASIGGYSYRNVAGTGKLSDHATGRAIDIMLGDDYRTPAKQALGHAIANYWAANLTAAGGHYVIFDKRIYTSERPYWRPYHHPGGGGDVLDHVNHVHLSLL